MYDIEMSAIDGLRGTMSTFKNHSRAHSPIVSAELQTKKGELQYIQSGGFTADISLDVTLLVEAAEPLLDSERKRITVNSNTTHPHHTT